MHRDLWVTPWLKVSPESTRRSIRADKLFTFVYNKGACRVGPRLAMMQTNLKVITVRAEQAQDEDFLFQLYASTRQEELEAWGWPPEMRKSFLAMQFKASQAQRQALPDAEFQIVLLDGVKAGRMVVHRSREELRLVY